MTGYVCLREDGEVLAFGAVASLGSARCGARDPAAALATHPEGDGYWVVSRRGRVTAFDVPDVVGPAGVPAATDVVDLVATSSGRGLWALDASGGVFCFGKAPFHGSVPGLGLPAPVDAVALVPTSDDGGYWVLDRTGGVFSFGNARFAGSMHETEGPRAPSVALLAEPDDAAYTVVMEDGRNHAFGRAAGIEPVVARHPVVAATRAPDGVLLVDGTGIVYPLGTTPFLGSPVAAAAAAPIVDIAWWGRPVSG